MSFAGERAVVCGAGGFIGGHLIRGLQARGVQVVRAVDVKPLEDWYQVTERPDGRMHLVVGDVVGHGLAAAAAMGQLASAARAGGVFALARN